MSTLYPLRDLQTSQSINKSWRGLVSSSGVDNVCLISSSSAASDNDSMAELSPEQHFSSDLECCWETFIHCLCCPLLNESDHKLPSLGHHTNFSLICSHWVENGRNAENWNVAFLSQQNDYSSSRHCCEVPNYTQQETHKIVAKMCLLKHFFCNTILSQQQQYFH